MRLLSDAATNKTARPFERPDPAPFLEWLHICEAMAWTIERETPQTILVCFDEP